MFTESALDGAQSGNIHTTCVVQVSGTTSNLEKAATAARAFARPRGDVERSETVVSEKNPHTLCVVLPERIELSTSPLPRECSTPELRQRKTERGNAKRDGSAGVLTKRRTADEAALPEARRNLPQARPRFKGVCHRA